MDAFHTGAGLLTKWSIESTVGGVGAREVVEISANGGSFPDQRAAFAGKAAGTPLMQAPDTFLANALHIGYTPDPGAVFVGATWATATPALWGATRAIPFSRFANIGTFTELLLCESDDDLWFIIKTSVPAWYGGRVGAWMRTPIQANGEGATFCLCGYQTSGSTAITSAWSNIHTAWLGHHTGVGNFHSYVIQPGTSNIWPVVPSAIANTSAGKVYDTTATGERLYRTATYQHGTTFAPIGEAREMGYASGQYRTIAREAGVEKYILIGPSVTTNVDAAAILI